MARSGSLRAALASLLLGSLTLGVPALGAAEASRITIHADDVRLDDLVAFVENTTGLDLEPLWETSSRDGLDPSEPVSLHVDALTPLDALDRLLDAIETDGFDTPTWQRRGNAIQIGPRSRLNDFKHVVIYDLRDIAHVVPTFDDVPDIDLQSALQSSRGGGGGGLFREDNTQREPTDPDTAIDDLLEIIRTMVEPDQWQDAGGDGAVMRRFQDVVIIRAPNYIHRQIDDASAGRRL
jgi:hypothetical protein